MDITWIKLEISTGVILPKKAAKLYFQGFVKIIAYCCMMNML